MKIILACISLALVACTRGQATSSINYQRIFGIGGCGRRVRSGTGGGGSRVVRGFYLKANSGSGASSSNIQEWGASAKSVKNISEGGGVSASNLPGPISLPISNSGAGSYWAPAPSEGSGGNNFQAWDAGVHSVSSQGSGESASGYNLQVSSGGNSGNKFQDWGASSGWQSNQESSGGSGFEGWIPIVGVASNQASYSAGGSYNSATTSYDAPSASVFAGGASNQAGNGGAAGSNFQDWGASDNSVSSQDFHGSASSYNVQVSSGRNSDINFQGWGAGTGGQSNQGSSGGYIGNSQGNNGGAGGVSFQSYSSSAINVSKQGGNGGGSNSHPSPIGNTGGASFQDYSTDPISSSRKGGKGISGRSIQANGLQGYDLGGYQAVPAGFQTTEGRHVDPDLLQQIRSILLREEASSGYGGGASGSFSAFRTPSSSYGAPWRGGSGRVIGITIEGMDQSIQIAEFHQTTLGSGSLGGGSSLETLAIPSGSYGASY